MMTKLTTADYPLARMGARLIIIALLIFGVITPQADARRRTRLAKPLKKIRTDTIAIPSSVFDELPHDDSPYDMPPSSVSAEISIDPAITILGETQLSVDRMWQFVQAQNPDFPREIAEAYHRIGRLYGIRGDIALCQSILETGWFRFTGGTAVTMDQNNFCGLGVTRLGMKGHSFSSVDEGVTAQIQHLYAYACTKRLPHGERLVDPRFKRVKRGVAPRWADLNRRWAANDHYAARILELYARMVAHNQQ